MCKFIGKSNERILCKLSKSEILRLYSIVHVAMETTKTSNFNRQSKSFISIFFTCKVSACELQPFSCYDLANDIYSQTAKTVFSHLKLTATAGSIIWNEQRTIGRAWHLRNNMPCICEIVYGRKITIYRSLFRFESCFLMQYIRGEILAWIVYLLCNFKGLF